MLVIAISLRTIKHNG